MSSKDWKESKDWKNWKTNSKSDVNKESFTISNIRMTGTVGQNNCGRPTNINMTLVNDSNGGIGDIKDINLVGKDFTDSNPKKN